MITKVCKHLISIVFNELYMEKVQLTSVEYNLPSRAVAQRLGMTLKGIVTNTEKRNGRIMDHTVNGLFKES
ncbi:GNAT family protein [Candidatus Njordibacter sp. Uisw_039]|uniref:GNAT family N-acetyltransferase n=1 Tax=Candidatus Njordibacter sp. Uisw_039 TaxID=3230972 RepID=UPI003D5362CC